VRRQGFGWSSFIIAIAVMVSVSALLFTFLTSVFQEEARSKSISSYHSLYSQAGTLCEALPGEGSYQTLTLPSITESIYAANRRRLPANLSQKTERGQLSSGSYLCLKLKNEGPRCEELPCNITIPYLGARKTAKTLAQRILGKSPSQKFGLSFSRQQQGVRIREQ